MSSRKGISDLVTEFPRIPENEFLFKTAYEEEEKQEQEEQKKERQSKIKKLLECKGKQNDSTVKESQYVALFSCCIPENE